MLTLRRMLAIAFVVVLFSHSALAQIVNSEWNVANGNWNVAANWFPNASPNNGGGFTFNVQIGNRPVAANAQVTFIPPAGTSATISTLTVSNGADLFTKGNQLNVLGATVVDGAGTTIRVDSHATPGTAALTSLSLALNNGGGLTMSGGIATVSGGQLEINAGSVLGGNGTINVGDADALAEQAFDNSALLQPQGNTAAPQTLTIHANGLDTIDLDGDNEAGVVDVDNALANTNADTVTLVIDGPLADPFGGAGATAATIQIGQRDTLTFTHDFSIAGAVATPAQIQMTGGSATATLNGAGNITSIQNSVWTISGAAQIDNGLTFVGTANTITVGANSSLTLNGAVTIPDASALNLSSSTAQLIIGGNVHINEPAGDFNWDGPGVASTTIQGTGQLTLDVNRVDTTDDVYGGTLNLNDNGDVAVNNAAANWTLAGTINKNNSGTSTVSGKAMIVNGTVNVHGGTLSGGTSTFNSGTHFNVDAGATATMSTTTLNAGAVVVDNGTISLGSASALAGASISGTGLFRLNSTSSVTANTTINTTSFDWDGIGSGTLHTINNGVVFTINSTTWDPDDAGDVDDPINLGGNGAQIIVNNVPTWTMTRTLTANNTGVGTATIGGSSRLIMTGAAAILNVNGQAVVTAPITFGSGSTVNIASGQNLDLNGGDSATNLNQITGATVNGAGTLVAETGKVLSGNGTINANIDFNGNADLEATGGQLNVNGTITDVGTLRTNGALAILNLATAFNTSVTDDGILMSGGTLQGATVTIASSSKSLRGAGVVTTAIINSGEVEASGATLQVTNAASDWDGAANTGALVATSGGTLELNDNATFGFTGTVTATGGSRVFTNGFALDFNPGSSINLTSSTYDSTNATDIGGAVNVNAGPDSTLKVQLNHVLTIQSGSTTTLNGNLRLESNIAEIAAGATFSGTGAIIVPAGTQVVPDANASLNVLLDNEGAIDIAGFNTVGRVDVRDYQQASTGELLVELTGTALNAFDRLVVNGAAQLDGNLNIDLDGGFEPILGNTFNIITASAGVSGSFDTVDVCCMPAGLAFQVDYMPFAVRLEVVNTPALAGDYNNNGAVDAGDYVVWRKTLGQTGPGLAADGNGNGTIDNGDFNVWRTHFGQTASGAGSGAGSSAAASVPEPMSMVMLIAAAILATCPRRRRPATSLHTVVRRRLHWPLYSAQSR